MATGIINLIIFILIFTRFFLLTKLYPLIKIAPDKWKHFLVGILMGVTLQLFTSFLMPEHFAMGIIIAFILVIAISYGFEVYSLITKKGHYEILDAVASIIGGVTGMATVLLVEYIY